MQEIIRTRLKTISQSVELLVAAGRDTLNNLAERVITLEEARIVENKLNTMNEHFVSETYNYFRLINEPSADEVSHYTSVQMQAQELVAELRVRARETFSNSGNIGSVGPSNNVTARLPRMELARFDGDVLKWDQFSSNVDGRNINDVDKMLYLQSVLKGEAKQAIDGLDTTNKNYEIAVKTLKDRYGKTSTIIDAHYVALYRIQTTDNSIKSCRNTLSEIERHLRVLQSLGEDVNHNHLRVMIMEKFPEELIYELRVKLKTENESIDSIRKNLDHIISARETSNRLKKIPTKLEDKVNNFTLETFHARAENTGPKSKRQSQNFMINRSENVNNKGFERFRSRKRTHATDRINHPKEGSNKRARPACVFCQQDHFNDECPNVRSLTERKRRLKGRCFNCLGKGHAAKICKDKRNCHHCKKYGIHNRALCPEKTDERKPNVSTNTLHVNSENSITILQTGIVRVFKADDRSRHLDCRVLLDCGSQRSYVTAEIAKRLTLSAIEENLLTVFTFGTRSPQVIESSIVELSLFTRTNRYRIIRANVVPLITDNVPCPYGNIRFPDNLLNNDMILADDGSRNDQVDILIGNDYYYSFMTNQKIEVEMDLFLVNSHLGWLWSGRCSQYKHEKDELSVLTYVQTSKFCNSKFYEADLPLQNDQLKQLWDLESIGIVDSPKCSREEEAIRNFNDTTQYIDHRYYVKWPWVEYPPISLPVNFGLALGRLTNLVKRLDSNTIEAYNTVLKDQLDKGIIEKINKRDQPGQNDHPVHYLPHHCVLQDEKTTKLRIVYDASAKTKEHKSLNECLYRGPQMLEDLTGLLIRFRKHRIGIVADVEKAFLQVGLQLPDRDVTRFLWLKNVNKEVSHDNIQHFRFCRVPFGVISSPFLLNATVKHHLLNIESDVVKRIAEEIYVDNLVTGAVSDEEALVLFDRTKEAFQGLSMNIREWNSNSKIFINHIPQEFCDKRTDVIKVLGIEWDTKTDTLKLNPNYETLNCTSKITKRSILKVTASIYDPCGFVAPIVLPAKLLLQKLWKQKFKWDEILPQNICQEWSKIKSGFKLLKSIEVPRFYGNSKDTKNATSEIKYELHGFSDSSKQAYAAVVYLRGYEENKDANFVSFVIGKSRLSPIKDQKDLQIPRLELLAAVIGNRLLRFATKSLNIQIQKQILWVDSEIVLSWYNSRKLLPPFVARRIADIRTNKDLEMRYVPTKFNPADVGTRTNKEIFNNKLWISGPFFLKLREDKWPKGNREITKTKPIIQTLCAGEDLSECHKDTNEDNEFGDKLREDDLMIIEKTDIEKETVKQGNTENQQNESEITNGKESEITNKNESVVTNEKENEEIKDLQKRFFSYELKGKETNLSRSLRLFKDKFGILRCGGRFQNTDWPDNRKYPVILPKNTDFTTKIIEDIHKTNYHVGVSHTLSLLRKKFWVIQGRSQVQKVLKNCIQCRKYGGGPYKIPIMPPLPIERVQYFNPFTISGLDYFGPMRVDNGSTEKRWVCLFTCLSVRAIHMEIVKDLTADECVMAIRRFVAVRGLPQVLISDNATQFKLTSEVLTSDYCIKNNITWRFIPELAPWFGGFYERLIGIVKNCLKRTLDKHLLTDNQLFTIIKEVEAVVNTRPLATVSQDLDQILTPADFLLVGGILVPHMSDTEFFEPATVTKQNLIESWKRGQLILKEYIKMFTNQYLDTLRERRSVHRQPRVTVDRVPKVGDVVQIKSDQNRALWKVGQIMTVVKSTDGKIRVAKVKLPSGETFNRSIGQLFPLEFNDENYENDSLHTPTPLDKGLSNYDDDRAKTHYSPSYVPDLVNPRSMPDLSVDAFGRDAQEESPDRQNDARASEATKPKRVSAQRARELLKQWTKQLLINLN